MSRSKRAPVFTEGYGGKSRRYKKAQANNKVKRSDVANGSAYKRVFNPWDICDFKIYAPKNKKAGRK